MSERPDNELLQAYAADRSERTFKALVERHAGLVYATALRQLGDRMLAEEVAQNVFIALARKPEAFRYESTVAGWLYKTTLLQSRQCLRTELRRRRRESVALDLGMTFQTDSANAEDLAPLLDEAMLTLRETDRLAVVLRFFEDKPLREVGGALGVSEAAAQKRVAKALDLLSQFFRRRGFAVPAVAVTALAAKSAVAIPASLAATIAQVAVQRAAAAPLSGAAAFSTYVMTLSKTQMVAICLAIAVVPAAWQWLSLQEARAATREARAEWETAEDGLSQAKEELSALEEKGKAARATLTALPSRTSETATGLPAPSTQERYGWSDSSDYFRVPKSALMELSWSVRLGINFGYPPLTLSDDLIAILQMTPEEQAAVATGLTAALEKYHALRAEHYESTDEHVSMAGPFERNGAPAEQISFKQRTFPEAGKSLHTEVEALLLSTLGEERSRITWKYAGPSLRNRFGNFGAEEKHFTFRLMLTSRPSVQIVEARAGGTGLSTYDISQEKWAPEAARPTLARWRALIEEKKRENRETNR